ncbi:MAG: ImuA family protein [Alphaproteobacteria bacterium]
MAAPQLSLLPPPPRRDAAVAELRRLVHGLERAAAAPAVRPAEDHAVPLGLAALDRALPGGGLGLGALHEVVPASPAGADAGAGAGFVAALLARLLAGGVAGPVLWCLSDAVRRETGTPYAPGLAGFGLDPGRLLFARARRDADVLWAMREGLGCAALAAVVGEAEAAVDLAASRRLQLAAGASGVPGLLLWRRPAGVAPSAALTRWRVAAAPGLVHSPEGPGRPRWRVGLERCRGGVPRTWLLEWRHETGDFALAAALPDRSAEPVPARLAG